MSSNLEGHIADIVGRLPLASCWIASVRCILWLGPKDPTVQIQFLCSNFSRSYSLMDVETAAGFFASFLQREWRSAFLSMALTHSHVVTPKNFSVIKQINLIIFCKVFCAGESGVNLGAQIFSIATTDSTRQDKPCACPELCWVYKNVPICCTGCLQPRARSSAVRQDVGRPAL